MTSTPPGADAGQRSGRVQASETTQPHAARLELLGELIAGLRQFSLLATELVAAVQHSPFTSNNEMSTLVALYLDGPLRPRDLAATTEMTTGGMSGLIDRLEGAGLVQRVGEVAGDGRGVLVELTADGRGAIERSADACIRTFVVARPLVDRWREIALELGYEAGRLRLRPRRRRSNVEQLRTLFVDGHRLRESIATVAGPDDPTPMHTVQVLQLASRRGGIRPGWISDAVGLSSASTTDLLDRLEGRGLLVRSPGEAPDRRAVIVALTDDGRDLFRSMIEAAGPEIERFLHNIFR